MAEPPRTPAGSEPDAEPTGRSPVAEFYVGAQPEARRRVRRALMPVLIGSTLIFGVLFGFLAPVLVVPLLIPIVVLLLLAIWSMPDLRAAPTRLLEILFWAFFVLLVLWPNYLAIVPPGMPWITMIRLTGFPLVLMLLVCVSVSRDFRAGAAASLAAMPATWRLLIAFTLVMIASIAFPVQKTDPIQHVIVYLVSWVGVFFVSAWLFRKPGTVRLWALLMWFLCIPIGLIAIWENRLHHVPWAYGIPRILRVDPNLLATILAGNTRAANGVYRSQSVFTSPLTLAQYLAFAFPFILHFGISKSSQRWMRVAAFATLPFVLYVVFLSGSRLGFVGALIGIIGYGMFWSFARWLRNRHDLGAAGLVFSYPLMALAAVASTVVVGHLRTVVWGGGAQAASTDSRKAQYAKGFHLLSRHPWGFGVDQGAAKLDFAASNGNLTIDTYWLDIALNYGILGFFLFYGFILWTTYRTGRLALELPVREGDAEFIAPLAVALFSFFVIASVFAQQDNNPIVFMMLGMACALAARFRLPARKTAALASRPFLARPA